MLRSTLNSMAFMVLGVVAVMATMAFGDADVGYYPVGVIKYPRLWVVPEGEDVNNTALALPNESFYVYSPNDSLILKFCTKDYSNNKLNCTDSVLRSPTQQVVSDDSGFVYLKAYSQYPVTKAPLGMMIKIDADTSIQRYYTFYLPDLEFSYVDAKGDTVVVEESSLLSLPVDSSLTVYVRAVVPVGPDSGSTDTLINKTFYFGTPTGSGALGFYTAAGDSTNRVDLEKGIGSFVVKASSAVSGATFSASGFEDPADPSRYQVSELFPGKLTFENPDLPTLDSAFIYDADGDGAGDSIVAYFSGKTDSVSWDSVFYNWPDGVKWVEFSGDFGRNPSGTVMELSDVKTSIPADSGEGNLKVHVTSKISGSAAAISCELQDRIGPAIEAATLIVGVDGAVDTLVLDFNKDIDTSFSSGKVIQLSNGDKVSVTAIAKDGDKWTFSVKPGEISVGDSISLVAGLGDLGIVAADGNVTTFNLPAEVTDAGRVYLSDENNGFYDSDADGRMDSVTVGFKNAISSSDLESLDLQFYWLDTAGNVLVITPEAKDLTLSADGKIVSYALSDKWLSQVRQNLTSIDSVSYGFAALESKSVVNGDTTSALQYLAMNDRIAPVISATFLSPESNNANMPDQLVVTFSEPVDTAAISNANYIGFVVDGDTAYFDFSYASWNENLTQVGLLLAGDRKLPDRANPNDSLFIVPGVVSDICGNALTENSPLVGIVGDPRVLMETASLIGLDRVALAGDGPAFTERFFPEGTSVKNEMGKSLGVMLDIAFATIFDDSTGESLDLEKVGLHWELDVYTNLGGFVAHGYGSIRCDDPDFEGNCFEKAKRLYLRWNLRADTGRKVGVGVYLAQFHLKVNGEKDSYRYDKIFRWGVHGGKGGLALDD